MYHGYIWAVLIALDQLGNALAGGHPDVTISARLGYLFEHNRAAWLPAVGMVDWAFRPVQPGHCGDSYDGLIDACEEHKARRGNDVGLALMLVFVLLFAVPLRCVNVVRRWGR